MSWGWSETRVLLRGTAKRTAMTRIWWVAVKQEHKSCCWRYWIQSDASFLECPHKWCYLSLNTQGLGNERLRVILACLDKRHVWGPKIQVISLWWFKVPLIIKWPVSQEDFNSVGFPTWEGPWSCQSEANVHKLHFKHISFKVIFITLSRNVTCQATDHFAFLFQKWQWGLELCRLVPDKLISWLVKIMNDSS